MDIKVVSMFTVKKCCCSDHMYGCVRVYVCVRCVFVCALGKLLGWHKFLILSSTDGDNRFPLCPSNGGELILTLTYIPLIISESKHLYISLLDIFIYFLSEGEGWICFYVLFISLIQINLCTYGARTLFKIESSTFPHSVSHFVANHLFYLL